MLAESAYKGVLDNGNFREFLHGAGEFSTFKTGIPGGPALQQYTMSLNNGTFNNKFYYNYQVYYAYTKR